MSSHQSRDKGVRTERAIVRLWQAQGFAAPKISGRYNPGTDISISLLGSDTTIEVTRRANGLARLYDWLNDVLIGKAVQEPLVALRLSLAAEIAKNRLGEG